MFQTILVFFQEPRSVCWTREPGSRSRCPRSEPRWSFTSRSCSSSRTGSPPPDVSRSLRGSELCVQGSLLAKLPHLVTACIYRITVCFGRIYIGFHRRIWTNVSSFKTQCSTENAWVNGMCKCAFKKFKKLPNACIFKELTLFSSKIL